MSLTFSIDHIFVFVENENQAIKIGHQLGLSETYKRIHPGQGTSNICFCFENTFLELLWVSDQNEIQSENIKETKLFDRSKFLLNKTCPFGISYRRNESNIDLFENWNFYPPYLKGLPIHVTLESKNEMNPFVFKALNSTEPKLWDLAKQNGLQNKNGWSTAQFLILHPKNYEIPPNLKTLISKSDLFFNPSENNLWELEIILKNKLGHETKKKVL